MEKFDIGRFKGVILSCVELENGAVAVFDFEEGHPLDLVDRAYDQICKNAMFSGWEPDPDRIGKFIRVALDMSDIRNRAVELGFFAESSDEENWECECYENVFTLEEEAALERIAFGYIRSAIESYFILKERALTGQDQGQKSA